MPRGNGTGPSGLGPGIGRGLGRHGGRGRMGDKGLGAGGNCVCPSCGTTVPHQRGVPCYQMTCPKCGTKMTRFYNKMTTVINKKGGRKAERLETKIKIDESLCSGCGICVDICPDVFEIGDNGIARVKYSNSANQDCVAEAAENCPRSAIILEE